ncbi:hypothetical protein THAOC_15167, partial [Thalassiosira oceanica]
ISREANASLVIKHKKSHQTKVKSSTKKKVHTRVMAKSEINKHRVPETKSIQEGSAKRNITRKHDFNPNRKEKKQGGGGGGKAKWNKLDDGSL